MSELRDGWVLVHRTNYSTPYTYENPSPFRILATVGDFARWIFTFSDADIAEIRTAYPRPGEVTLAVAGTRKDLDRLIEEWRSTAQNYAPMGMFVHLVGL